MRVRSDAFPSAGHWSNLSHHHHPVKPKPEVTIVPIGAPFPDRRVLGAEVSYNWLY